MKHIKNFNENINQIDFNQYRDELMEDWEEKNGEILDNESYGAFQVWALEQAYNLGSKK